MKVVEKWEGETIDMNKILLNWLWKPVLYCPQIFKKAAGLKDLLFCQILLDYLLLL
jgi:hypothetical protein